MSEEIFEHKEKYCPNMECPERLIKLELDKKLKEEKAARDILFEQLQELKNILARDNKAKKDDKGKVKEKQEEDVKILVERNLELSNRQVEMVATYKALDESTQGLRGQVVILKNFKENTEEKAKKQVDEYASLPERLKRLSKELEDKGFEVKRKDEELLHQEALIQQGKKEIKKLMDEQEKLSDDVKAKKDLRKQEKLDVKKVKRLTGFMDKTLIFKDKLRLDQVKKLQVKMQPEFDRLTAGQKPLVQKQFEEVMKL